MGQINIIGHVNPDVDSIISGYLLQEYLKYKNLDASFIIPDKRIDKDTEEIIKEFGLNYREFKKDIIADDIILVDNHETNLSKNILGIIDHHPPFYNKGYYINIKASATAKIIYDIIIKNGDKEFLNKRHYELIFLAIIIDTDNFRNPKAIIEDKEFIKEYSKIHSINLSKMYKLADKTTDLSDLTKAIYHGKKEYKINDKSVKASYITINSFDELMEKSLIELINKNLPKDCFLWIFMIVNIKENKTILYEVYKEHYLKSNFDRVLSRGTDVIPMITKKI